MVGYDYTVKVIITCFVLLLHAVNCGLPSQLLHHPVTVVNGSQGYPLMEGQVITYTCPPGFVQTGPNASVCAGNGEWEPDPGEMDCIGNNYAQHNDATYFKYTLSNNYLHINQFL